MDNLQYRNTDITDLDFTTVAGENKLLRSAFSWMALAMALTTLASVLFYFVPEFIAWLLALNLHNATYAGNTGGDLLVNQFLLFNCFLSVRSFTSSGKFSRSLM